VHSLKAFQYGGAIWKSRRRRIIGEDLLDEIGIIVIIEMMMMMMMMSEEVVSVNSNHGRNWRDAKLSIRKRVFKLSRLKIT
jgi:hypothetical protein